MIGARRAGESATGTPFTASPAQPILIRRRTNNSKTHRLIHNRSCFRPVSTLAQNSIVAVAQNSLGADKQWPLRSTSAVYAEVTIADCGAISHEIEAASDAGLTADEACVLKLLLDRGGMLDEMLAHPEKLIGRKGELAE